LSVNQDGSQSFGPSPGGSGAGTGLDTINVGIVQTSSSFLPLELQQQGQHGGIMHDCGWHGKQSEQGQPHTEGLKQAPPAPQGMKHMDSSFSGESLD